MASCSKCNKAFGATPEALPNERYALCVVCPKFEEFKQAVITANSASVDRLMYGAVSSGIPPSALPQGVQSADSAASNILELAAGLGKLETFVKDTPGALGDNEAATNAREIYEQVPCRFVEWSTKLDTSHLECDRSREWGLLAPKVTRQGLKPIFLRSKSDEALRHLQERIATCMQVREGLPVAAVHFLKDDSPANMFRRLLDAVSLATQIKSNSVNLLDRVAPRQRVIVLHELITMDFASSGFLPKLLDYHRLVQQELAQVSKRPAVLEPLLVQLIDWQHPDYAANAAAFVEQLAKIWDADVYPPLKTIETKLVEDFVTIDLRRKDLWPEVRQRIFGFPLGLKRKPSVAVYSALEELLLRPHRRQGSDE